MKSKLSCPRGLGVLALAALLSGAAPLGATPPITPYERLERRAAAEGAAAVRAEYRHETEAILARLTEAAEMSRLRTLEESLRLNLDTAWLHEWLHSWAQVEAREVRAGKTSASLAEAVVLPLVECLERGHSSFEADLAELERLRAAATPEELARLGLTVSPAASLEHDRTVALRQVALLAKLGKNRPALERLFQMSGGTIDQCATPEEFLAFDHDWESILGGVR